MVVDEFEEHERHLENRRQRIRLVLKWLPLAVAGILVLSGGIAVWSVASGHDADRAEVAALAKEKASEADEAEDSLHEAWAGSLENSAAVKAERIDTEGEQMYGIVNEAAKGSEIDDLPKGSLTDVIVRLSDQKIPDAGDGPFSVSSWDASLVTISGTEYTWKATAEISEDGADEPSAWMLLTWTVDEDGTISSGSGAWAAGPPQTS